MSGALKQPLPWLWLSAIAIALVAVFALLAVQQASAQDDRGAVSNLRLSSPNEGELLIEWDPPSETPADYRVVWAPSDENYPSYKDDNTDIKGNAYPTAVSYTVSGLAPGAEYKAQVRARFSSGGKNDGPWAGPWSGSKTVTIEPVMTEEVVEPDPTPEPQNAERQVSGQAADDFIPTNFSGSILNGGMRFTWAAPSSGTVKNYEFRWDTDSDLTDTTKDVQTIAGDANRLRADARGGTGIKVWGQVRAQDDSDDSWGPWTHALYGRGHNADVAESPAPVPDTPAAPTLTRGDRELTVTWTAPDDNDYSILRYWVRHTRNGQDRWTEQRNAWKIADGGNLSYTISPLINGQSFDVQVKADSLAGRSAWSATTTGSPAASTATVAAGTSPITEGSDAVFTVTLNPAPASNVTVNYGITVSGDYGVSAATNQTVTVGTTGTGTITLNTANDTVDEANGSVTVTLATGTGYGLDTANSASVTVNDDDDVTTPAPDGLSVARGNTNTSLFLQWNHKTGATSYHIQYATNAAFNIGEGTTDVSVPAEPPTQMTHYLEGLATGSGYYIRVASENAGGGRSDWSATVGREQPRNVAVVEPVADSVTEGNPAQFRFSVSPSNVERRITYNVTVSGDFGVSAATGRTIDVTGSEVLDLATTDDGATEADGSITVTITHVTGSDYFAGTPGSATVAVQDGGLAPVATSTDAIPATWSLVPAGLVGNQFRLLFVTSGTRDAASTDIGVYNTFVQNAANADGVDAVLKGFRADFKVVGCTDTVNATANTATTGTGVPIYWVDGAKVADNYADFYDDSWDSNAPRNQKGELFGGNQDNPKVWTGCNSDGTKGLSEDTPPKSRALGGTDVDRRTVTSAHPKRNNRTISGLHSTRSQSNRLYALSPVLTLVDIDYDTDDDGLIEVNSLAKLNAIRWDPDGDGAAASGDETDYAAAFPTPATGMGCPASGCTGYELTANLNFDTNGSGGANDGDTYWNGGAGWDPIGNSPRFTATFEGNGNTIANLFINRGGNTDYQGLFARLDNATVRDLVMTGASVTAGDDRVGILAGRTYNTTAISGVSVSGDVTAGDDIAGVLVGATSSETTIEDASAAGSVTGNGNVGGLVGNNAGAISRSWSSANVFGDENTDPSVRVGGLAGYTTGAITASFATGIVSPLSNADSVDSAGGLIGEVSGQAVITASYAAGSVTGRDDVGGLIGAFINDGGSVVASYATGSVTGGDDVGGLVGSAAASGVVVTASYSTGAVMGTTNAGGLIGRARTSGQGITTVTDSYWDTESSGQATSAGGTGKTGAELRAPTAYTGIYANWNVDLNGDSTNDDPWDFGANYSYPTLRNTGGNQTGPGPVGNLAVALNAGNLAVTWTAPTETGDGTLTGDYAGRYSIDGGSTWTAIASQSATTYTITSPLADTAYQIEVWAIGRGAAHTRGGPASVTYTPVITTDYDSDDDGLIEVDSLAKLNAIRWDMDGDGAADSSGDNAAYATAFPSPVAGMGCPASGCTGYELGTGQSGDPAVNLDFDDNTAGERTDDTYWNGGEGWRPIGGLENAGYGTGFNATFDGNGHTISNLGIDRRWESGDEWAGYRVGLFGLATQNSVIRNLTLAGVNVRGDEEVGGLVGLTLGEVNNVTVSGSVNGATIDTGGVVGFLLRGNILSSSFDGAVSGTSSHMGGLVGSITGGAVRHSSASGTVGTTGSLAGRVGGLAGSNTGIIYASHADNNVTANGSYWVGGLVGQNGGPYAKGSGTIVASYSQGDVSGRGDVGGLVGENYATILISYSTGAVHKHGGQYAVAGGLVGRQSLNNNDSTVYYRIGNSHWSTTDVGWNFGVGSDDRNNDNVVDSDETNTVGGSTTTALQTPTGYTGLYQYWDDADENGNAGSAQPWCFGTSSQLPTLKNAAGTCP